MPGINVRMRCSTYCVPNGAGFNRNCEMYGPAKSPGVKPRKSVFVVTWPLTFGPRKLESLDKSAAAACAIGSVSYLVKGTSRERRPVQLHHFASRLGAR